MYGLFCEANRWRGASGFGGPGPLEYQAVKDLLSREGLVGHEREMVERVLMELDDTLRSEINKAAASKVGRG